MCQHNNINHETAKQQNATARTRKFVIFFLSRTVYPCHNRFRSVMPVFSPLLVNFIRGNHDWLPLIHGNPLLSGLIEGRFSQYILLNLLLDGKILPVLTSCWDSFFTRRHCSCCTDASSPFLYGRPLPRCSCLPPRGCPSPQNCCIFIS